MLADAHISSLGYLWFALHWSPELEWTRQIASQTSRISHRKRTTTCDLCDVIFSSRNFKSLLRGKVGSQKLSSLIKFNSFFEKRPVNMHDHFYIRDSRASLFDKQHGNRCSHKICFLLFHLFHVVRLHSFHDVFSVFTTL